MSTLLTKLTADFNTQLSTAISVGGTTATLLSQTDDDGNTIPDGVYVFTLDGSNSNKEYIRCTKTGTSLTSIQSLSRQGALTTGAVRAHRVGCSVIITDWAQLKYLTDLLTGTTDLDSTDPLKYDGTATITDDNHLATKKYADDLAIAGAPDANTTTKGLVELATQAEYDARTATGGTGASLFATPALNRAVLTHDYAADAGSTDAYAITLTPAITAYTTGDIYYFKANTINTGACTLNVNAVGAKSLKFGGADPYNGFIAAGAYVACQYDGTNLNIIWCSSSPALSQGQLEIYGADSVGTDAYAITPSPAITAYAAGQVFRVKLGTANTGACTLSVSGLSALAIKKNYNADTITGDLLANQIIEVAYDSTNTCWQLLSPVAQSVKYANGSTTKNSADASTTQNIAHGLGVAPKYVKITALNADTAIANGTAPGFYYSYTTYNGTTQSSLSINRSSTTAVLLSTDFRLTSGSAASTDYTAGVVTVDATNIIITWTKNSNPTGTYSLVWEAQT